MRPRVFSSLVIAATASLLLAGCDDGGGGSGGSGGGTTTGTSTSSGGGGGASGGAGGGGASGGAGGGGASVEGTVIGFGWPAGAASPDLVEVNPATGTFTKLFTLPPQNDVFDLGTGAFDPASGHLFQLVDDDPSDPDTLLDLDLTTGTLAASVTVDLGAFAHVAVFAAPGTGKLLGLGADASGTSMDLVEVDVATGAVSSISPIPALANKTLTLSSARDAATGHAYFVYDEDAPKLLDLDTATGDASSVPLVPGDLTPSVAGLAKRPAGGLVGVSGKLIGAPPDQTFSPYFISLDPGTGALGALAPLPSPAGDIPNIGASYFDAAHDRMWLIVHDAPHLLAIDAAAGDILLDTPLDTSVYSSFVPAATLD